VFAYAAGIAQFSYEELDAAWERRSGVTIGASFADVDTEDWDAESFREALGDNLEAGRFRLVIAVDIMTDELQRTVRYINEHSRGDFQLLGLELRYIADSGVEILTPVLYGKESAEAAQAISRTRNREWDEGRFFDELVRAGDGVVADVARRILEWAPAHGLSVHWGAGTRIGGMNLRLPDAGYAFLMVQTDGKCVVSWGMPHGLPKVVKTELRTEFRRRLEDGGVKLQPNLIKPYFSLTQLVDASRFVAFSDAVDWVIREAVSGQAVSDQVAQ
jgi:hypothetical protein